MPTFESRLATSRGWVDPYALPTYMDASLVAGNASLDAKQLTLNTLGAYGVGGPSSFGHAVGKQIRLTEMDVDRKSDRLQITVVADVQVTKEMLNGAGTVHGGCICYLIDICASTPLVALGVIQDVNGVGVSQAINVFFHAPASIQTCMRITSTSVTLGRSIMTSRCEITDKKSGRVLASALLGKMQPKL